VGRLGKSTPVRTISSWTSNASEELRKIDTETDQNQDKRDQTARNSFEEYRRNKISSLIELQDDQFRSIFAVSNPIGNV
jgi:hypothetical protein